jgi:ATP-dependent exoDNAse (exonuclease V) alpha subunit
VLVVDEAGMLGSRKLTRLLEHANQAQARVVLVGDDRQLAAIDAGGGFRALRLRLGASELVENRRQQQTWECEALDLVRSGLVEEAVAAYQAHDRVVAADSKPAATLAAARGRLGGERLQVEDRQVAVGDRVVCGHNGIGELGVANGSRGVVTGVDPQARTLTVRLDGRDRRTALLPQSYLDGRHQGERNRQVDLAYATTGHRAQGLTRGRALVRLTGSEDVNWLYVQLSRARQDTRLYAVVGPEPQRSGELDLADRDQPDGYLPLAQALSRVGGETLAIDTPPASISGGYRQRSYGRSGTGYASSSIRLLATAAASWNGPAPTASRLNRPWPPISRPPVATPRHASLAGTRPARRDARWESGGHPAGQPGS